MGASGDAIGTPYCDRCFTLDGLLIRTAETRKPGLPVECPQCKSVYSDVLIDYMRQAGRYDIESVQALSFAKAEAVRRAGAMLEKIAPGRGGNQAQKQNDTNVVLYF